MVDYTFYTTVYLGSAISEKSFPGLAAQAQAQLDRLKRCCRVSATGEDSEKMALCAMAEAIAQCHARQGVRATSIGGVSVSYSDSERVSRAAYRAAQVYLDIYRGVRA